MVQVELMSVGESKTTTFEALVNAETRGLYRIAVWILGDSQEAQDAVQETFTRAWRSWGSVREESRREAWLRRTCVNRCLTLRRQHLRRRRHDLMEVPQEGAWLSELGERAMDLHRAMSRLSPRQRAVLSLHYRFGYKLDECAELLGMRPGTVRAHLARGLATLRKELGDV